jgi:prephenate dehydratase
MQQTISFNPRYIGQMITGTLGPDGSYSGKAARQWSSGKLRFYDDIPDTVEGLLKNEVDFCVVPVENSLEGSVTLTLDLLMEHQLKVVGEEIVQVKHLLLSKARREDVKIIMSHPQALSQCRRFIKTNFREAEVRPALSTSHAARLASESKDIAAIASREAAEKYGLDILAENIQDRNENFTRFIVIGKNTPPPTGNDKTSIIVYLEKNRPGALYEILGEFSGNGIDLTKIESRPTKKVLGDYLFYIDIKGHIDDGKIKETLGRIKNMVGMLKIIGSYPVAK